MVDQEFTPSWIAVMKIREYKAKLSTMLKHLLSEDW